MNKFSMHFNIIVLRGGFHGTHGTIARSATGNYYEENLYFYNYVPPSLVYSGLATTSSTADCIDVSAALATRLT